MEIRNITENDIGAVRTFIRDSQALELHTSFTYWILAKFLSEICFIAVEKDEIIGFVGGIRSTKKENIVYLWQLSVAPAYRRQGVGASLIGRMMDAAQKIGAKSLQFTIAPDNFASYMTFTDFAYKHRLPMKKIDAVKYSDPLTQKLEHEDIYEFDLTRE